MLEPTNQQQTSPIVKKAREEAFSSATVRREDLDQVREDVAGQIHYFDWPIFNS